MSRARGTRMRVRPGTAAFRKLRTCRTQKVSYATRAEALDQAEIVMAAGHVQPGCHVTPYRCHECGAWHVGNRRIVPV